MRSIGKRNIRKLQAITREERALGIPSVDDRIKARIPAEWYDLWESAHDEINRVIDDERLRLLYGKN